MIILTGMVINLRGWWSLGRRIKSEKHETSLFLVTSKSARVVIEAADCQVDRTSSRTWNGTGQAKLSPRS